MCASRYILFIENVTLVFDAQPFLQLMRNVFWLINLWLLLYSKPMCRANATNIAEFRDDNEIEFSHQFNVATNAEAVVVAWQKAPWEIKFSQSYALEQNVLLVSNVLKWNHLLIRYLSNVQTKFSFICTWVAPTFTTTPKSRGRERESTSEKVMQMPYASLLGFWLIPSVATHSFSTLCFLLHQQST